MLKQTKRNNILFHLGFRGSNIDILVISLFLSVVAIVLHASKKIIQIPVNLDLFFISIIMIALCIGQVFFLYIKNYPKFISNILCWKGVFFIFTLYIIIPYISVIFYLIYFSNDNYKFVLFSTLYDDFKFSFSIIVSNLLISLFTTFLHKVLDKVKIDFYDFKTSIKIIKEIFTDYINSPEIENDQKNENKVNVANSIHHNLNKMKENLDYNSLQPITKIEREKINIMNDDLSFLINFVSNFIEPTPRNNWQQFNRFALNEKNKNKTLIKAIDSLNNLIGNNYVQITK